MVIGSTITEVLNLEPGTKYYVTVHAVNHNTVQISPTQRAQDSRSATTLLSAPFPGALEEALLTYADPDGDGTYTLVLPPARCFRMTTRTCQYTWWDVDLEDDDFQGTHFALYGAAGEAGQHYFRWLNPYFYGPYDHVRALDYERAPDWNHARKQADLLSLDQDGRLEDLCSENGKDYNVANGKCGPTHYRFKAVDANGDTVASELVEIMKRYDRFGTVRTFSINPYYFQTVFTAGSGELTLSVSLGRMVDGRYRAMSDTASVAFEAPEDLRAHNQTYGEYRKVLEDIANGYDENEDLPRWLGRNKTGSGRSIWNLDTNGYYVLNGSFAHNASDPRWLMEAHLNDQLK